MPLLGSSKNVQVCRSSAIVIEVIGFVKMGSGREVVEAMGVGPRRGGEGDEVARETRRRGPGNVSLAIGRV